MLEIFILIPTSFFIGLLGSGHCLGMCGGLMSAFTIAIPKDEKKTITLLITYNIGRISSYTFMGVLFGIIGLTASYTPINNYLRIISGILMILLGLYISKIWNGLNYIEKIGNYIWKPIQPLSKKLLPVNTKFKAFVLGLLWSLIPCGLIYSTLAWAVAQGSIIKSSLIMFFFGLGTFPILIVTSLSTRHSLQFLNKKSFYTISGCIIILFGIYTIPGFHQDALLQILH